MYQPTTQKEINMDPVATLDHQGVLEFNAGSIGRRCRSLGIDREALSQECWNALQLPETDDTGFADLAEPIACKLEAEEDHRLQVAYEMGTLFTLAYDALVWETERPDEDRNRVRYVTNGLDYCDPQGPVARVGGVNYELVETDSCTWELMPGCTEKMPFQLYVWRAIGTDYVAPRHVADACDAYGVPA